ncbi:unnamed protein product [Orchesella dallaii]|uniref:Uncharacterized protein n=1 Tax=Orchesella dallaii TaxID=48710 RepID=A0ABP1SAQ6_9HEXA
MQKRIKLEENLSFYSKEVLENPLIFNDPTPQVQETFAEVEEFVYYNTLRAFYGMGWKINLGEQVTLSDLTAQLGINEEFKNFFGFLFKILESRGILRKSGDTTWKLISEAPKMENVLTYLTSTKTKVNQIISYTFGLMDGFWRFDDLDLRRDHCTISQEEWEEVAKSVGFGVTGMIPFLNHFHSYMSFQKGKNGRDIVESDCNRCWILFNEEKEPTLEYIGRKLEGCRRKLIRVSEAKGFQHDSKNNSVSLRGNVKQDFEKMMEWISSRNLIVEGVIYGWSLDKRRTSQEELLQPYFHLVQAVISLKQKIAPRLICLTKGIAPLGDQVDLSNFHAINFVELSEFTQKLRDESGHSHFAMFKDFYKRDEELVAHYTSSPVLSKWLEGAEDFWVSKKLQKLAPSFAQSLEGTMEVLERDILFAKKQGWFQKMGL